MRNRIIVIGVVLLLIAVVLVQSLGIYDFGAWVVPKSEGFDPIAAGNRIEQAAPWMDVMHVGVVDSFMLGNPVFHVAVRFFPQENPYSVEMTDTGYRVLGAGEYTWEPGQEESVYDEWHFWTEGKYRHYSQNALFPPGKAEWILPAVDYLGRWFQDRLVTQFLLAVYEEAYKVDEKWVAIEISYLGLAKPELIPGIDSSGKPGYIYKRDAILGVIELQWKKLQDTPDGEGYWMADAVERGEFTVDEYRELQKAKTIQVSAAFHPLFGRIPYTYGFNHPWDARDVSK